MNILDALNATRPQIGQRCSVGAMLDTLTPEERGQYVAALQKESGYSSAHLRAAFIEAGHPALAEGSILRHRSRKCRCSA